MLLLVHDVRPPFLDGRTAFTRQAEPVMPIKDPTSDMAVIARAGSKLVLEIRQKKEASKSRARFWEVAGSKLGKITGRFQLGTRTKVLVGTRCTSKQALAARGQHMHKVA